ncbi:hypothetical protein HDU87_001505 [Geranomyces variabilis]|uniref:Uncharacterized protein n=1 Tax=Geranomyces variabilis TaxID=109894 RepID=A0AAD5TBJ5_9FUNG|nr:hypothetical protein HDU87_001505 [Geranomyces variabilis]
MRDRNHQLEDASDTDDENLAPSNSDNDNDNDAAFHASPFLPGPAPAQAATVTHRRRNSLRAPISSAAAAAVPSTSISSPSSAAAVSYNSPPAIRIDPATRTGSNRFSSSSPPPPSPATERAQDAGDLALQDADAAQLAALMAEDSSSGSRVNNNAGAGIQQHRSLRGRPASRYFSAGAAFPASPLRDRISTSTYSAGEPSRRVSQTSRTSNYSLLLTPTLSLYPPSESAGDDSGTRRAGMTSVSSIGSYPHSMISYSSRDSHASYTSSQAVSDGGGGGTATPLSSVLSAVSDDDPYLAQVMELATQQYRDKASCDASGSGGAGLLKQPPISHSSSTPPGTISSRRGTRSSTIRSDAATALQPWPPLASVSEAAPAEASAEDPATTPPPAADLNASMETMYRAGRCKQYFETRYAQLALLQSTGDANIRYNPLEIIRWRRAMWQRAVRSGAEEQKKWKLRYYTWHVGNTELAEFYADKVLRHQQQQTAGGSSVDEDEDGTTDGESADDFLGNVGKVIASRWMRGLKRRQQMDDEKDERGAMRFGRASSSNDRDPHSLVAAAAAAFAGGLNRGAPAPGKPASLLTSPRSTDAMGREEDGSTATPSLLLQFLGGAAASDEEGGNSVQSLPAVPAGPDAISPQSVSEESGAEQPKVSMETSKSSLSGTRPDSDIESVGDMLAPVTTPGHGRKKSGLWDRIREKRGDFHKPSSSPSASSDAGGGGGGGGGSVTGTPLSRKRSIAGAVDHLTHRMRRASAQPGSNATPRAPSSSGGSNAGTLERAYCADAERTLGSRSAADVLALQRARTPSPLKLAHNPSIFADRTGSEAGEISRDSLGDAGTGVMSDGQMASEQGLGIRLGRGRRPSPGMVVPELRLDVGESGDGKDMAVAPSGSREEGLASDSDDGGGTGRVRGRRLKNMMGKIGRRQHPQSQHQREKGRSESITVDDGRGSNNQSDKVGSGNQFVKPRKSTGTAREVKDSGRSWGWESSSSDEDGASSVFMRSKAAAGKSERRARKAAKKRGTMSEAHSNSDLTEASESFRTSPSRKKAMRGFIGNKLRNASSVSLGHDNLDEDENFDPDTSPRGRDGDRRNTRAPTTATDMTTTEDEADVSPLSHTATAAAAAGPAPRDPNSPLTPEEQGLYDGLLALGTRLDLLMPDVEVFKTELATQIATCKKTLQRYSMCTGGSGGIRETEEGTTPQSLLGSEDGPFVAATTAIDSHDAEDAAHQTLSVMRGELDEMAQHCQEVEERNGRSHEQVSAMVSDLDAVTQEVNEDLSRQLKMVEEAIQQIEGTPKALGSMQEWYYQLIAYFLGCLGFTIWLWFQLWKILRKGIAGARIVAGAVSPKTVSAVDGLGLAAGKAVKERTLRGWASATGIAAVAATPPGGEAGE